MAYRISYTPLEIFDGVPIEVHLPSSKSLSNRALVLQTLAGGNPDWITGLSKARDTQTLYRCLHAMREASEWYVGDAGTTLRFVTALAPILGFTGWISGTPRLQQRPIKSLLKALEQMGVEYEYHSTEHQIPYRVKKASWKNCARITLDASESSQFVSALMMIAPYCSDNGLVITLENKTPTSWSYVEMTASLMAHWGCNVSLGGAEEVYVPSTPYIPTYYQVAPDWSSATYFMLMGYLTGRPFVLPSSLFDTFQPDRAILDFLPKAIFQISPHPKGLCVSFKPGSSVALPTTFDFSRCPDMALTCLVWYAASGYEGSLCLTGLHTLNFKESQRLTVLRDNLAYLGYRFEINGHNVTGLQTITPSDSSTVLSMKDDHRMIMALAPLAVLHPIIIDETKSVSKSFPNFAEEFCRFGFNIQEEILST